jgi:hypothetical protein
MSDYTFCVSLSITHPSITPDEITAALNITPSDSFKLGDQRIGPKGKVLPGKNKRNFWRVTPHSDRRLSAKDILLEDYLLSLNNEYVNHKEYFSKLVATGGYIEYFIGWFNGEYNLMATLPPELLRATGELHIAIGIDAYSE